MDDYLYGEKALEHYLYYQTLEKQAMHTRLEAEKAIIRIQLMQKKTTIEEALESAKGKLTKQYSDWKLIGYCVRK